MQSKNFTKVKKRLIQHLSIRQNLFFQAIGLEKKSFVVKRKARL